MKKLNILLTLFIVFFVGTIIVNAKEDNNYTTIDDGSGTSKNCYFNSSSFNSKWAVAAGEGYSLVEGIISEGECTKYEYQRRHNAGQQKIVEMKSKNTYPDENNSESCTYTYDSTYEYKIYGLGGGGGLQLVNATTNATTKLSNSSLKFSLNDYGLNKACPTLYYDLYTFELLNPTFYNKNDLSESKCYIKDDKTDYMWTSVKPGEGWIVRTDLSSEFECKSFINRENYVPIDNGSKITAEIVSCGNGMLKNIPYRITKIISTIITVIQVGVPVLLIIFGMLDFAKGIVAQKEDEITKGRKTFITRLITAILVFFVIFIVKVAVRFVADTDSANIINCVNCFISADCDI